MDTGAKQQRHHRGDSLEMIRGAVHGVGTHKSVDGAETLGVGGLNLPMKKDKHRANLYSQRVQQAILSFLYFFFNLTYSRWTSSLPSCLWSQRIFPSLPGSRLTIFYRVAISALLQLVNQWLNFTYSRSHAFRYETKNTNPNLVRIKLTTSALAGVQVTY